MSTAPEVVSVVQLSVSASLPVASSRQAPTLGLDAWTMRTLDHAAELALDQVRGRGRSGPRGRKADRIVAQGLSRRPP
jgi:hypothetical protein